MDCVGYQGFGSLWPHSNPFFMRTSRMENRTQRSTQSFRRMLNWRALNDGILQEAPAPILAHFKALGEVTSRIEANATTQTAQHQASSRDATDAHLRREAVRDAMRPIAQIARSLQGTVFGISSIGRMPKPNTDNEKLVIAANSMAANATIFAKALIDHGLQPDCIETLQAAAAALKSSIDARGTARATAIGARNGIRSDVPQARKLVSLIDAGLMAVLKDEPAALASWKNAKRITVKGVVGTIVPSVPAATAPSATPPATTAAVSTTRAA